VYVCCKNVGRCFSDLFELIFWKIFVSVRLNYILKLNCMLRCVCLPVCVLFDLASFFVAVGWYSDIYAEGS
jgi:hypothetical protein